MTRYQEVLGGNLEIMGMAELPEGFGAGGLLMASDDPNGDGTGVKGAALNITVIDPDDARRIFAELAEGGSIDVELGETFWSPLFGSCVDRFGGS